MRWLQLITALGTVTAKRDWPGPSVLDSVVNWATAHVDGPDWIIWCIIMITAAAAAFLAICMIIWVVRAGVRSARHREAEPDGV